MRIISGTAKGRKLHPPPLHEKRIRPTSDRAREALFNIIGKRVINATVLDLFAGTGALGLEAFSRNARFVVFVDNSSLALQLIKKNILLCLNGYSGKGEMRVIKHDLCVNLPLNEVRNESPSGFDLIFIDPPYEKNISLPVLNSINKSSLLTENGLLIVEERFKVQLPTELSQLHLSDKRVYGETAFFFYKPTSSA